LFTAGGIIYKNFIIEPGGTIGWNGNPLDATIDIQAAYNRLKTSLYQLTNDPNQKKVDVDCRMFLTGKLMNPSIRYDIYLPNADQESRNTVNASTNSQEDLSNQFLSLLITNNFLPSQNSSSSTSSGQSGISAASVTGIEFLSNQLSRMMSQFSKDFDIGFNYRPNDYVTTGQVEMAMSTQLLNDRIIINGNVDVGGQQVTTANTNKVIGEGNVEVKITNNGKLRLKAYNRANQSYLSEYPYTQGVGILYKEDFNSFNELIKHYYKIIFTRKEERPKTIDKDTTNSESTK